MHYGRDTIKTLNFKVPWIENVNFLKPHIAAVIGPVSREIML